MVRIQFEMAEEKVNDIQQLMKEAHISTRKDLFNNALTLLEWAIKEKKAGRVIASIDEEEKKYRELVMPIFSAVAK